jgi:pimeloyl-ACP methyl ester carboxylesterase
MEPTLSTWVLLRGLTRGSGHWADFPARLQRQLGGAARIVLLDLPGNGALHALRSPTRIARLAGCCQERLHALGAAPPYYLLGVSMGAMVALEWSRVSPPGTVAGCVLVNTSLRRFSPLHHRLRPSGHLALLRVALAPQSDIAKERAILRLTSCNAMAAEGVVGAWAALRAAQPVSRTNALRQLLAAARYTAPEQPPPVPLLVLSSRGDALVDARCSEVLSKRWSCAGAVHAWAGHDLTLDDGDWVAAQIGAWLGVE